jgi:hypothetical protein
MWIILGIVGALALTRYFTNLKRSHKNYPKVWEHEFYDWHKWDQAANLTTAIGAFAGIALSAPLYMYFERMPGEANAIVMPVLICLALLVPGGILGSIAQSKKNQAGIK